MLKQEDRYKFKTSLGFDMIPRSVWTALQQGPVKTKGGERRREGDVRDGGRRNYENKLVSLFSSHVSVVVSEMVFHSPAQFLFIFVKIK